MGVMPSLAPLVPRKNRHGTAVQYAECSRHQHNTCTLHGLITDRSNLPLAPQSLRKPLGAYWPRGANPP